MGERERGRGRRTGRERETDRARERESEQARQGFNNIHLPDAAEFCRENEMGN